MELNETQKATVAGWVKEGCGLAEIQKRLASELSISMTFMDVRFLVIDLGLKVRERPDAARTAKAAALDGGAEPAARGPAGGGRREKGGPAAAGGVSLTVDRVMKPGSLVSGSVTFSDGVTAAWSLDELGRLALQAQRAGYRPSEEDVMSFRREIQAVMERQGF
jgi:hypothetical protein